jgi:DNA-binding CsgD family transcriptional regulator
VIPQKYYEGKIINQDTKVLKINQSLLINLDNGFLVLDSYKQKFSVHDITVEGLYQNNFIAENSTIAYNQSIELDLISDYFGYKKQNLFYKLNREQNYNLVKANSIVFNNLLSGNQVVDIYFFDGNKYQNIKSYRFNVQKPWYFSFWMLLFYAVLISLIFYVYFRWNKFRYVEKFKRKEEELHHKNQIEQLEKETANKLRLQEYENHILEIQVQTKASEVAGKSLSIAKQSEMIESIETILNSESDAKEMKSKIKRAIKNNSINKNEWQIFEKNLMKSHEDFVHKLTNTYQNLTSKDIKLCIYLRMNLASKEIAPLMNISYRGVELHRYRLRKKLDIVKEESLTNFMINI